MDTLGIIGADGRMGRAVEEGARSRYAVKGRITLDNSDPSSLSDCGTIIDFSSPTALIACLPHMADGTAVVSGTTGLSEVDEQVVTEHSGRLALLRSGNFSLGIAVLRDLARRAAASLGDGWDVEILEMHHRHKVDAPSGTALMLGAAVADGRGVTLADKAEHDRSSARKDGDIGFAVLRGGGVYGMHEVRLVSDSEMITLGHQALNRDVFAHGALAAADWLRGKAPGLYSMNDLIKS